MSATSKRNARASAVSDEGLVLLGAVVLVVVGVGGVLTSMHLGHALFGGPDPQANPVALVVELVRGETPWTAAATWAGLLQAVVLVVLLLGATVLTARRRSGAGAPRRVDAADAHMGRGSAIAPLTRKHAAAVASRLGVTASPGVRIGSTLKGTPLYRSWEDVVLNIAGPRTGKTTAFVIPEIVEAPGAVLATSNKRDIVDATRHVRAAPGPDGHARQVWVFDPQNVVNDPTTLHPGSIGATTSAATTAGPAWWWNPLSYVTSETKAAQLAAVFFSAATEPGQSSHAYFTNAGRNLLTNLILAAALDRQPISQIHRWLSRPDDDTAVASLESHGYPHHAGALSGVQHSAPEQRAGVYGTAQEVVAFLTDGQAMRWALPPDRAGIVEFKPEEFVRTRDTLYSLSREGRGNAGALVTALTVAVCEAAEDYAKTSPGGRLETPMVVSLDEAANVCRWHDLPDLYSHYGSRGILISTYLQSWSQGAQVWGREGIQKLWSAANVKVYGGGVSQVDFLRELSALIGEYRAPSRSVSTGKNGRSVSTGDSRLETILDVSDLATLERGRAIVLASGAVPALIRTEPWMTGPHATAVQESINLSTRQPVTPQTVQSSSEWARVTPLTKPKI